MILLAWLLRTAPWLGAAVGLWLLCSAMLGQAAISGDLNEAMQGVLVSIRESGRLTRETAVGLRPLVQTADVMERMNGRLREAGADLSDVNGALERVVNQQSQVQSALERLNGRTEQVVSALYQLDPENQSILAANRTLAGRTEEQATAMERLSQLTGEATNYMARMNRRFAFLR